MALFKKRHLKLTEAESLFLCMEVNARKLYHDMTFWDALHAIDRELTPGCIRVEPFTGQEGTNLESGKSTKRAFNPGENTVVIELQNKETAILGTERLNELFKSTGTHFVAESPEGKPKIFQIRSNIDKPLASKLSVMSKFFFDREVKDPQERERVHAECQDIVDCYTKGTDAEGWWKSREGVLPFVSLMGLHGNLRPKERNKKFNAREKEREINSTHPRGNPAIFDGVVVHVEMNNDGCIYSILYDRNRDAYEQAQGHVKEGNFLRELLGGDWRDEGISPPVKALRITGFLMGVKGIFTGELLAPLLIGGTSVLTFGADVLYNRNRINKRLQKIKAELEKKLEEGVKKGLYKAEDVKVAFAVEELPVPPEVHHGYTAGNHDHDHDPVDTHGAPVNHAIRRIIEAGKGNKHPDSDIHDCKLQSKTRKL